MGVTYDLQRNYVADVVVYNTATKINPSYQKSLIDKNADIDMLDY